MKDILDTLQEAADQARVILLGYRERGVSVETKGSAIDLVTEADLAAEAALIALLTARHPGIPVLAEESARSRVSVPGPRFVIDPLDGTTNFAHGVLYFSVSLAFQIEGVTEVAMVDAPCLDERFTATRGGGARRNGWPIQVSRVGALESSLLVTGFPIDRNERIDHYLGIWRRFLLRAHGVLRTGSAALDLCHVAAGRVDGFWEEKLAPWDTAAGSLVVTEAGGRLTTLEGAEFSPYGPSVLATNGAIHDACLQLLRPGGAAPATEPRPAPDNPAVHLD